MIKRWFSKASPSSAPADDERGTPPETPPPAEPETPPEVTAPSLVDYYFLMLLWREPNDRDRRDSMRALEAGQSLDQLAARLLASPEFRLLFEGLKEDFVNDLRPASALERALQGLGTDEEFVARAYDVVLGRAVDPSGGGNYTSELKWGKSRRFVLKALLLSDEFAKRHQKLAPQAGFVPRDVQLCELANPAKWDNPEWRAILSTIHVGPADKPSMHRKGYEFTQLLFGLQRLAAIGPDARVLSVGAGHEPVLYWLANHTRKVVATDMYGGLWTEAGSMEGHEAVFTRPEDFAPFPYEREHLVFMKMDGRVLAFADDAFDVVYSLSSIEHFGGFEGALECMNEMARVLKPGGILAVATEYCLAGPPHHEAFQPADVHRLLTHDRLQLVQPIDERVWERYDYQPVDLRGNIHLTPHMVVTDLGSVFTSVIAFLRKTTEGTATRAQNPRNQSA